jgi:hypothetical protein
MTPSLAQLKSSRKYQVHPRTFSKALRRGQVRPAGAILAAHGTRPMNVELVLVLFVALLYGPTVLWLVVRTLRGHRRRLPESFASEHASSSQLASRDGEALDDPDAFWACAGCRSLNRRESSRCYSCRLAKDSASRPAPGQQTASGWVPVMADDIAESTGAAGGAAVIPPAPWSAPKMLEVPDGAPEQPTVAVGPGAPGVATVCPFLGLRSDPSTRYDFPDPGNSCRPAGTTRSQPIDLGHQQARCLTVAHVHCARYRAVEVVAGANR